MGHAQFCKGTEMRSGSRSDFWNCHNTAQQPVKDNPLPHVPAEGSWSGNIMVAGAGSSLDRAPEKMFSKNQAHLSSSVPRTNEHQHLGPGRRPPSPQPLTATLLHERGHSRFLLLLCVHVPGLPTPSHRRFNMPEP